MPIINSLFDNDLYKFTMQRAVLNYKQGIPVKYVFNNRNPQDKFYSDFDKVLTEEIRSMAELRATDAEIAFLQSSCPFLDAQYIEYIRNFRFNPDSITVSVTKDRQLSLEISDTWENAILWEVPLMAIISELYFADQDNWNRDLNVQSQRLAEKTLFMKDSFAYQNFRFSDFGTRRRRSYLTQNLVVKQLSELKNNFIGTSNVHFAHKYNLTPIGTMAHEWIMGISALESLRYANRHAMQIWSKIYQGKLGTALTDTFGDEAFWKDFDGELARLYDGIRHDSGCPFEFVKRAIRGYENLGIDPATKTIVFSDGLDFPTAIKIFHTQGHSIKRLFGIGTNLTNDYTTLNGNVSKPLNMVIKMSSCNSIPVVKLSNNPLKAIGDPDAVRVAKWTHFGEPLDKKKVCV